jgi:hypothetical protein
MNPQQHAAFAAAIAAARTCLAQGALDAAQTYLERAHVLGQAHVWPHVLSHWLMLRVALRRAQWAAVLGQAVRIGLGAAGSAVGVVPTGNTGGSDIGMFRRLPVAPELQALIDGHAGVGSGPACGTPDSHATRCPEEKP